MMRGSCPSSVALLTVLIVSAAGACAEPAPAAAPAADTPPSSSGTPATARPGPDLEAGLPVPLDTSATATQPAVRIHPPTSVEQAAPVDWAATYAAYPCNQWAGLAIDVGWPIDQIPKLLRTMWRESRCDMTVRSTTSDSCGVQINDVVFRDWRFKRDWPGFDTATIFDPRVCLSVGYWLYSIDGWRPWRGGA